MNMSNSQRVDEALTVLSRGLSPFVERELGQVYGQEWQARVEKEMGLSAQGRTISVDDAQSLLKVMISTWHGVFSKILGPMERALVSELLAVRNRWAHREPFSTEDTYRALDSAQRLLVAMSAREEADELEDIKQETLRILLGEHDSPGPGPEPPPGDPSVLVFSEKRGPGQRQEFEAWLRAHMADGFYINCGGSSPMLHTARCPHLEPDGPGSTVRREKACSTSLADLESWAAERGWSLRYCLTCGPRA